MSRIYFRSASGEAEVRGPERHNAGNVCTNLTEAVLSPYIRAWSGDRPQILSVIPSSSYLHAEWARGIIPERLLFFEENIKTWLHVGMSSGMLIDGRESDLFTITLNTALRMGSDVVKLLARLHGQCEIHCYVEGPNRAWLADLITTGRDQNILRPNMGWEDVVTLLRQRSDEPVVCSYSVCEGFPNADVAGWSPPPDDDGEDNWDAWYELPYTERWNLAMTGVRKQRGLELRPDDWGPFYFDDGFDAFLVARKLDEMARVTPAAAAS